MDKIIPIFDVLECEGQFLVRFKRATASESSINSFYFKVKDDDLVIGYAKGKKQVFAYTLKGIPFGILHKIRAVNVIKVEEAHSKSGFDFVAVNAFTLASWYAA